MATRYWCELFPTKNSGTFRNPNPRLQGTGVSCSLPRTQELSGTPNPRYFFESNAGTNRRRTAVQMGGVLRYKWEVYCGVSLSSRLRSQQGTALQMGGGFTAVQIGGVLPVLFRQVVQVGGS